MASGLQPHVIFHDVRTSYQYQPEYQNSKSAYEQGQHDLLPLWQVTFFYKGADYFLQRVPDNLCTTLQGDDGKLYRVNKISEEEKALLVFARFISESQSIIDKLQEQATCGHFFSTASFPQTPYVIDYKRLMESLVLPQVNQVFPGSIVECSAEDCVVGGHLMMQLTLKKTPRSTPTPLTKASI